MNDDKPETEVDEPYYSTNMEEAPKEGALLLVIPTGEPDDPLAVEMGYWDAGKGRWEGEWRNEVTEEGGDTPTEYAKADPVAWGEVPDIDEAIYSALGLVMPADEEAAAA